MKDLSSKIANLMDSVREINAAKDLSDQDIKHILPETKQWETKVEELVASGVKFDIELFGLNTAFKEKLVKKYKDKLTDKAANHDWGLFALNKDVYEVASYRTTFHGKSGENVYKFTRSDVNAHTIKFLNDAMHQGEDYARAANCYGTWAPCAQ